MAHILKRLFFIILLGALFFTNGNSAEKSLQFLPTLQAIPGENKQGVNFNTYQDEAKRQFNFVLSTPANFNDDHRVMMFVYPQNKACGKHSGAVYETLLMSQDKECAIALIGLPEIENVKRTEAKQLIDSEIYGSLNALDKKAQSGINVNDYVTSLSAAIAKNTTNADYAYLVDFPKMAQTGDLAAWTHCQGLYFEKKGQPMFFVKVLYTDKGYANMAKYLPAAFSVFRYGSK